MMSHCFASRGVALGLAIQLGLASGFAGELLPPGFRPVPLGSHALVGGRVVIQPGEVLERGTILLRNGFIQAVGKDIALPADARVWAMEGTTIYAGFIDPYLVLGATNPPVTTAESEPVTSSTLAAGGVTRFFGAPTEGEPAPAGAGYGIAKVNADHRAVRDYVPATKLLAPLRELGFTAGVVAPAKGIIRGISALVALSEGSSDRVVLKPDVFQHVAFETHREDDRAYPGSVMGVVAAVRQTFFDAQHYALAQADYRQHPQAGPRPEFGTALEALVPAASRQQRVVLEPGSVLMVDRAGRVARELGLDFCLVSCGQEWRRPDLAQGAVAAFIVPLNFPTLPKLPDEQDWEQVQLDALRAWDWAPENPAVLRRQGRDVALTTYGLADKNKFRSNLRLAIDRGLSEDDALAALTTVPAKLCGVEALLGTVTAGKLANLTVVEGTNYFEPDNRVSAVWIDGRIYRAPRAESKGKGAPAGPASASVSPKEQKTEQSARELRKARVARSPLEGRGPLPLARLDPATNQPAPLASTEAANVVVRHATLWLCDQSATVITNGCLWITNGHIAAAGAADAPVLPDAVEIDGHGLQVTPGLIDCHSHTAILGAVNESTLPSTAMVRIRDVVNSETPNLYEQLAGGVTTVNLLHGSANPIGGQNCVIKLRDGAGPEDLVFAAAPPGIKFALGENVKQSNWGDKFVTRFPQTRMGVRTFIANRFAAAQQYAAEAARDATNAVPPRRDLELEALAEILAGRRWIHCHSYRQDEILMLLRLMEGLGVRIGTFQHVLEGYKVADEIARHGAGASTFSDWWAYKFEVYDAIAYNGSLLRNRGVLVSFNSDSSELARRLYLEAAKAVKYGGTPEAEALKFVTLNPARQLRIDARVGSLEPGKDADFVLWSQPPLDSATVCLQTWIEGRKYFDRAFDAERTGRLQAERAELIAKAQKLAKLDGGKGATDAQDERSFFRAALEHEFDGHDRHCLEEDF